MKTWHLLNNSTTTSWRPTFSSCYLWPLEFGGEGNGTPLQYSCLENPMDGGAWKAAVHGVAEGQTQLSDFTFTFHFHTLEKGMATQSSVLAWRILGIGEPGGLLSVGSHRVRHDWSDLAVAEFGKIIWSLGLILLIYNVRKIISILRLVPCDSIDDVAT